MVNLGFKPTAIWPQTFACSTVQNSFTVPAQCLLALETVWSPSWGPVSHRGCWPLAAELGGDTCLPVRLGVVALSTMIDQEMDTWPWLAHQTSTVRCVVVAGGGGVPSTYRWVSSEDHGVWSCLGFFLPYEGGMGGHRQHGRKENQESGRELQRSMWALKQPLDQQLLSWLFKFMSGNFYLFMCLFLF